MNLAESSHAMNLVRKNLDTHLEERSLVTNPVERSLALRLVAKTLTASLVKLELLEDHTKWIVKSSPTGRLAHLVIREDPVALPTREGRPNPAEAAL